MFDTIVQYQYNTQVSIIILFSFLSTIIVVFGHTKKSARYHFRGLLKFIWHNLILFLSLSTLFISSVFLVKLNAGSGVSTESPPDWVIPWWSVVLSLTTLTALALVQYCLEIMFDMAIVELTPSEPSEYMISKFDGFDEYKLGYYIVSALNSILLSCVFALTVISAVLLCDPGNC